MTSRFPRLDVALAGVAVGSLLTALLLPPTPYLAAGLRPWALGLSAAWLAGCLWRLDTSLHQWHSWRVSPDWMTTPARLLRPEGVNLGQGFRWDGTHVQTLELAMRESGGLPAATGPRGGYPALQAVGEAEEEPLVLSWELMRRHVGLVGTTGSGKSVELQSIVMQAIWE